MVDEATMYPGRAAGPAEDHYSVDRGVLRALLLAGLGRELRFGAEFVRYLREPDGRVAAVFADGQRAVGDLIVGADGAGRACAANSSPVPTPSTPASGHRPQALPRPRTPGHGCHRGCSAG